MLNLNTNVQESCRKRKKTKIKRSSEAVQRRRCWNDSNLHSIVGELVTCCRPRKSMGEASRGRAVACRRSIPCVIPYHLEREDETALLGSKWALGEE